MCVFVFFEFVLQHAAAFNPQALHALLSELGIPVGKHLHRVSEDRKFRGRVFLFLREFRGRVFVFLRGHGGHEGAADTEADHEEDDGCDGHAPPDR